MEKEYNLAEDHKEIKKQIKGWEKQLDEIVFNEKSDVYKNLNDLGNNKPILLKKLTKGQLLDYIKDTKDTLEDLSHEMMAINI